MTTTPLHFSLSDLATAALEYLDLPHAAADVAATGISYDWYTQATRWANLAAQELADAGAWPWLAKTFVQVTVPDGAYSVGLPQDVHRLLSDPSYEDYAVIFEPVTLQQIQQLRAASTSGGTPYVMGLDWNSTTDIWVVDTVYALGDFVQPTTGETGFWYECTARAGDFKSDPTTEPTWPTTLDDTVVDDQITWTCRPMGQHRLLVWPPAEADTTLTIAYTRMLPEMTLATELPRMPPNLHRIVLTGTLAYAEAHGERNWGGPVREQFEREIGQALARSTHSNLAMPSLRQHRHFGSRGGYSLGDRSDITVTHD